MTMPDLSQIPPETILARLRLALESAEYQIKAIEETPKEERTELQIGYRLGANTFIGVLRN